MPRPQGRSPAAIAESPAKRVVIDFDAIGAAGHYPDAPRSQIADQYRVIKRPLIANAMGKGAARWQRQPHHGDQRLSGEGKSFTAINLAMSIAMELDTP